MLIEADRADLSPLAFPVPLAVGGCLRYYYPLLGSNRLDQARIEMSGCGTGESAVVSIKRASWSPNSPWYCGGWKEPTLTRSRFVFDKFSWQGVAVAPTPPLGINSLPALGGAINQADLRDRGQALG